MLQKDIETANILLSFVRYGMSQTAKEESLNQGEPFDWYSMLPLAKEHTVLGLFADATLKSTLFPDGSGQKAIARQIVSQVSDVNKRHLQVIAKVVSMFQRYGIKSVLLKGEGLAACYPEPQLRQSGDIDLYVDIDDFPKACQILDTVREQDGKHKMSEKHYAVIVDGVELELHHFAERICNPFQNRWFQRWSREELRGTKESVCINDMNVCVPPVGYNVVYTFCHLWNHFEISGIGLRHMCDMAAMLHYYKEKIDTETLRTYLMRLGKLDAWHLLGGFLVKELGMPKAEFPLYQEVPSKRLKGFTDTVLSGGEFGQPRRDAFYGRHKTMPHKPLKAIFYITQFFRALPYCGTSLCWRVIKHL